MSDYWISRDAQNMWEYMEEAEKTSRRVARVYTKSSIHITDEIDKIFNRYQTKNGLTKEEAYIIINQLQNKSSFNLLKRVVNNSSMKNAKSTLAELEAPAYRARIERFENLQSNIDSMMKDIYKQEKSISTSHYKKLAKKSYLKEMFGIQQKSGVGFGVSVDEKAIDKILRSKWSGSNYSSRIWKNTNELSNDVQELVLEGMLTGESSHNLAKKIQEKYNVGAFEARRLIRTESGYVSNEMKYQSMEDAGIKFYVFNATLDKRTSSVCRELDLKKYKLSEKQTGVNFPPMHPFCRSIVTSVLEGFEDPEATRIARNPDTGKNMKVPRDMSYADWEDKYVKDIKGYATDNQDVILLVQAEECKTQLLAYEVANIFSSKGDLLLTKGGVYDSVSFDKEELKLLDNAVVTHNHPMGTTLSPSDIYMAIEHNIQEVRAVTDKYVYSLRRNGSFKRMPSYDDFEKEYKKLIDGYKLSYIKRHPDYKKDMNKYQRVVQENAMKYITDKYGLYYRKRKS